MRLQIARLPAGGKHKEQGAIRVISGGGPGFLPSACNHFPALIAHLPAKVPAALEDDKLQHRSPEHRTRPIIPKKMRTMHVSVHGVRCSDCEREERLTRYGRFSSKMYGSQGLIADRVGWPKGARYHWPPGVDSSDSKNETPAVPEDRRGRMGKMVRGWGLPRCRAKDPREISPIEQFRARRFCKQCCLRFVHVAPAREFCARSWQHHSTNRSFRDE